MSSHNFYNRKADFVSALKINCDDSPREFRLLGSHQNQPTDWDEIRFSNVQREGGVFLNLERPVNYACLKLHVSGSPVPFQNISLGRLVEKSSEQIQSELRGKSIVFLCCARDCGSQLKHSVNELLKIASLFEQFQFYVFENDSRDSTLALLKELAATSPMQIFSESGLDKIFPVRTERLSYCRNQLLRNAAKHRFDYVVVADLDGVITRLEQTEFLSCFVNDAWDGCFPGAREKYYDLWALRHPSIMPSDYNQMMNKLPFVIGEDNAQLLSAIPARNLEFEKFHHWLEVESAFGGLALYRASVFSKGRYYGMEDHKEVCEHVPFHRSLKNAGAKLYINPGFLV